MIKWAIVLLCAFALTTSAFSQTPAPVTGQEKYVGELTGTNVHVRSGPGLNMYPCAKISMPTKVTVMGKTDAGWLIILPPEGCFSVIHKKYVKVDETGKTGTVTSDNIWLRAGGNLRSSDFWKIQQRVNKAQEVKILGEISDFYKIESPQGVYFYIWQDFVKPAAETAAAEEEVALVEDEVETTPAMPEDKAEPTTQPLVADVEQEEDLEQAVNNYNKLETLLIDEYKKPLAQRDLEGLLEKYQALKPDPDGYLKPHVEARTLFLQQAIEKKMELEEVEVLAQKTTSAQQEYEIKRTKIEIEKLPERQMQIYPAKGVLKASDIFVGNAAAPKRYMIRDSKTNEIIAYVQCTTGMVKLENFAGKNVGIIGTSKYDRKLATDVIEAEQVVVLSQKATLPTPPQPVVIPRPVTPEIKKVPKPAKPKPIQKAAPKAKPTPAPKPVVKPKPTPKPTPKPQAVAPAIKKAQPKPAVKPEPKPEVTKQIKPAPKKVEPKKTPATQPAKKSEPVIKKEPKPAKAPVVKEQPKAEPARVKEESKSQPEPKPAEKAKEKTKPLPPTGLPVASPENQPAPGPVNEKEYE